MEAKVLDGRCARALAAVLIVGVFGAFGLPSAASAAPPSYHPYLPALTHSGFHDPCGAAVDSAGDLYVASFESSSVAIFGPTGTPLATFATAEPVCSIAVDAAGAVYAAGFESALTKYSPSGDTFPPTAATTYAPDTTAGAGGVISPGPVSSVTVDPASGDIYAAEERTHVSVYEADGTEVGKLAEGLVPGAEFIGVGVFGENGDLYLSDAAHGRVVITNATATGVLAEIDGSDSPEGAFADNFTFPFLAVDQSDGHVLIGDVPGHRVFDEFDAAGDFVTQIGPEVGGDGLEDAAPSAVAVDNGASSPNQGDIYVTSATGKAYALGPLVLGVPPEKPAATTVPAKDVTTGSALLGGVVNPKGSVTIRCLFRWGLEAGTYTTGSAPCGPDPGSANSEVAVSAEAIGLQKGTVYHYEVLIETVAGRVETADSSFETLKETLKQGTTPVVVGGSEAPPVAGAAAAPAAPVNPSGQPTKKPKKKKHHKHRKHHRKKSAKHKKKPAKHAGKSGKAAGSSAPPG